MLRANENARLSGRAPIKERMSRMANAGTNDVSNDDKDGKSATGLPAPTGSPPRDGKEDWIGRQLRRVFDDALNEPLPDDIMSLLERIDEQPAKSGKDGA